MGIPGCLTCQRSVSTSTVRLRRSHTRPPRTSSPRTSRLHTSPSPTRSPATPTHTSATPSTSTPSTSLSRWTSSSRRGRAGRVRRPWAHTPGLDWQVRSWAWREARPGWGGKGSAGRSCCPRTPTAWTRPWSVITWACTTWATNWTTFRWVWSDDLRDSDSHKNWGTVWNFTTCPNNWFHTIKHFILKKCFLKYSDDSDLIIMLSNIYFYYIDIV